MQRVFGRLAQSVLRRGWSSSAGKPAGEGALSEAAPAANDAAAAAAAGGGGAALTPPHSLINPKVVGAEWRTRQVKFVDEHTVEITHPLAQEGADPDPSHWSYPLLTGEAEKEDFDVRNWDFFPRDLTLEELVEVGFTEDVPVEYTAEEDTLARAHKEYRRAVASRGQMPKPLDRLGRGYGTGWRKSATAQVWVSKAAEPGVTAFRINRKTHLEYFPRVNERQNIALPLVVSNVFGLYDVNAFVTGSGLSAQSGAIRLGLARALLQFHPEARRSLRAAGLLTRDPRKVERKKPGQKKARKKFAWVKR